MTIFASTSHCGYLWSTEGWWRCFDIGDVCQIWTLRLTDGGECQRWYEATEDLLTLRFSGQNSQSGTNCIRHLSVLSPSFAKVSSIRGSLIPRVNICVSHLLLSSTSSTRPVTRGLMILLLKGWLMGARLTLHRRRWRLRSVTQECLSGDHRVRLWPGDDITVNHNSLIEREQEICIWQWEREERDNRRLSPSPGLCGWTETLRLKWCRAQSCCWVRGQVWRENMWIST